VTGPLHAKTFRQQESYRNGLVLLGCLLLSLLLFANTFGHAWTYDDFPVIVENPDVTSLTNFLADAYPGRPLREMTYLVDYRLFGLQPAGWHLQSCLWHGVAGFLVFLLMVRLGLGRLAGGVAALLFLVHPITVEAVANISHRKESLTLVFALLSLLAWREFCVAEQRRWWWGGAALFCAGVAYLGKQTAVGIPLLWLAMEWVCLPRERRALLKFWKILGGFWLLGVVSGVAWFVKAGGWPMLLGKMQSLLEFKANYFGAVDLAVYLRMLLKSWTFMLAKLIWPVGLSLEYIFPVPTSWLDPWVLAGLMLVTILGAVLVWSARRRSPVFFWLIMAIVFYLPVANLVPLAYLAADRYLYAPWAALAMLVGWLFSRIPGDPRRNLLALAPVCVLLAILTWQQNRAWASEQTLWEQAVKVSPESSFVQNNLGNIHYLQGNVAKAFEHYLRAAELNPLNATAQFNLGMIWENRGNLGLALDYYRKFLLIKSVPFAKDRAALEKRLLDSYRLRFDGQRFLPR
jgi:hypothetical protein